MAAATSYYHFDAHGSTACLTNSRQTVTDSYIYRPFGNGSGGTTKNSFYYLGRYGYYYEGYNVFLYVRNRWYDTDLCRWFSKDPTKYDSGDWNLYRYVGNNPVNLGDPSGRYIDIGFTGGWFGVDLVTTRLIVA